MKPLFVLNNTKVIPLATLANRYIKTVNESVITEAKESLQFAQLEQVNEKYQQAVDPRYNNEHTLAIDEQYDLRESLFTQMHTYLNGLLNSPDETMKSAAALLFAEADKYGTSFSRKPLGEQSVYYIRIVEGLKKPTLATAVTKTLLADSIDALDLAQINYENLYIGRGNSKQKNSSPTKLRKELVSCIKKHLAEIEAMAGRTGNAAWSSLSAELQQRFAEISTTITKRRPDPVLTDSATDAATAKA